MRSPLLAPSEKRQALPQFTPPWYLSSGLAMTIYTAFVANQRCLNSAQAGEPEYIAQVMTGSQRVPLQTWRSPIATQARGTLIATYGITGSLEDQGFLRQWGRWAYERNYGVILFDWRAHGKSAELSPTLTSDGLYEGEDFVYLAAQAKALGYPGPFWFGGYSLGGQLALWGVYKGQTLTDWANDDVMLTCLSPTDIGGGMAVCPSLDSQRSLNYLTSHPLGRYLEKAIANKLKELAWQLHCHHPGEFDPQAIERANTIWGFDHNLVIDRLGFASVEAYYEASSALPLLSKIVKPTLLLYAADDPMFHPAIVGELASLQNQLTGVDVQLTPKGGHVGYIANARCQRENNDPDKNWAIHRTLDWLDHKNSPPS
ncbi:alpha/beta fold hydrolase [Synechocystis salina LEGE 06155]|nr:alpha/beta fold hydrolase [Synechocystis salina LEGE 06155]